MNNWQKTALILLIIGTLAAIKFVFFPTPEIPQPEVTQEEQPAEEPEQENEDVPKSYVSVYFIGQNSNKEEVYKIVKREYNPKEGTKLSFSINNLLDGPNSEEKSRGIYSEIPQGTKLLSLEETPGKIIINLSGDFEQGGGTDGLYKRLYQLIKTANKNTALDVYLYINGKQANVLGGEGIMISQPLNDKSLDE
ncbi:MAG: GerMN domain-containing protein [Candidatus Gastranaerophilales bacterium]|nr:GerMN domain-containing protein [Candidatus Gastranaerophilales bacterium]